MPTIRDLPDKKRTKLMDRARAVKMNTTGLFYARNKSANVEKQIKKAEKEYKKKILKKTKME